MANREGYGECVKWNEGGGLASESEVEDRSGGLGEAALPKRIGLCFDSFVPACSADSRGIAMHGTKQRIQETRSK